MWVEETWTLAAEDRSRGGARGSLDRHPLDRVELRVRAARCFSLFTRGGLCSKLLNNLMKAKHRVCDHCLPGRISRSHIVPGLISNGKERLVYLPQRRQLLVGIKPKVVVLCSHFDASFCYPSTCRQAVGLMLEPIHR